MNQNNRYINSKVLIGELYSDYNIQSDDFVTRFPNLCFNCIRDLRIFQNYVEHESDTTTFDNYIIPLPIGFEGIIDLIINDKRADLETYGTFDKSRVDIDKKFQYVKTPNVLEKYETNRNVRVETILSEKQNIINDSPTFTIDNNYIRVNIEHGTYKIRYKCIPFIYDREDDIYYPLIYDVEELRQSVKYYVLKHMLLRGYIHPILNLKENNKYTNPALAYDSLRFRVRTACNKFSSERRDNLTDILTKMQ